MGLPLPRRLAGTQRTSVRETVLKEIRRRSPVDPSTSHLTQIVRTLIRAATDGDIKAAGLLFDRLDGKPIQMVAHAQIDALHADPDARAAQASSLIDQLRNSLGVSQSARDLPAEVVSSQAPIEIGADLGAPADLMPAPAAATRPAPGPPQPQDDAVHYPTRPD